MPDATRQEPTSSLRFAEGSDSAEEDAVTSADHDPVRATNTFAEAVPERV